MLPLFFRDDATVVSERVQEHGFGSWGTRVTDFGMC